MKILDKFLHKYPRHKLNLIQPLNNREKKYILLLKKDNFNQSIRSQI